MSIEDYKDAVIVLIIKNNNKKPKTQNTISNTILPPIPRTLLDEVENQ
ncbi:MAG: hypothetical protein QN229_07275 [Desulfurococcaceae archaeon TW002]